MTTTPNPAERKAQRAERKAQRQRARTRALLDATGTRAVAARRRLSVLAKQRHRRTDRNTGQER